MRLKIVYENGGIYLDTDVELKKRLDRLLKYNAYFGFQDKNEINTGLGFGAIKHSKAVRDMMEFYKTARFVLEDGTYDITACPERNTDSLLKYGLKRNGRKQILEGNILILPPVYLCPINYWTGKHRHSIKTISVHWFSASWRTEEHRNIHWDYVKKKTREERRDYIQHIPNRVLMRIIGTDNYNKIKRRLKSR